jgi:hypothetical protein
MCGGKVVGLIRHADGSLTLHVQDCHYGVMDPDFTGRDACCIDIPPILFVIYKDQKIFIDIKLGDGIWWHDRAVMWTPGGARSGVPANQGLTWDIRLKRSGYSYSCPNRVFRNSQV